MPRLRKVAGMRSSKVAEMRICGYHAEEKSSAVPLFSQRSHVGNLRQTLQGKGVIHKRVETAGVYPLMLPRRVPQFPAASAAIPRGECRNPPRRMPQSPAASAAVPRCATAHSSPRNGEPFTRFGHTGKSVPRNLRSKSARRRNSPDVFPCAMPQNALYLFYMT